MKKCLSLIMILGLLFSLTACETQSSREENLPSEKQPASEASGIPEANSKTLVVYFSCTGNTKPVAEKIAGLTGADLYEIVPQVPYTGDDLNYNNDNCRANKEMNDPSARPEIGSNPIDVSGYDAVFIGYPIWWSTFPRIINTFLDTYDLSGKMVLPFCTSGGSNISQSVSDLKKAEPEALVKDGYRAKNASDNGIPDWLVQNGF